ncbi:MAG TPA: DUF488 domain-containing protein [Acidimicrobiales bacterium]
MGHGTLAADDLLRLLESSAVTSLVDIRTAPGSRRLPHMRRLEMETWVPASGIDYRWEPALGGFRKPRADSPNRALRNDSFRGYADYMQTDQFWEALDRLVVELRDRSTAVMCSEAVWWRCHRRLVADAVLLSRNVQVEHLMQDGRRVPHSVTEGARLTDGGRVVYDAGEAALFG